MGENFEPFATVTSDAGNELNSDAISADLGRLTADSDRYRAALERIEAQAVENERLFVPCSGFYRSVARAALYGEQ